MFDVKNSVVNMACVLLCSFLFVGILPANVSAVIPPASSAMIKDSQEHYTRRIYSYDMGVDSQGDVHVIYSEPYSDTKANIYYVRRIGGTWQGATLLSNNGLRQSISTLLQVGTDDRVHVCYIEDTAPQFLYYRVINNGVPGDADPVKDGAWHTRMQVDENGYPVFIREHKDFPSPGTHSTLALFTTNNGILWDRSYLNLSTPSLVKYRIADFVYANGTYHVTYGNSAETRPTIEGARKTNTIPGIYHDFFYATSLDGVSWTEHIIDNSRTLYAFEFWTSLALDDGRPVVAMYKYAEYGNEYNTGTSAILMRHDGSSWQKKTITKTQYPDSREGMGVGVVVNGSSDYFGAWDFSPSNTHDSEFDGNGNIVLARSGPENDWSPRAQLDPFSLEGRAVLKIRGEKLYFLALCDVQDVKLYFREYNISDLNAILPPPGWRPPGSAETSLPAVYHMLLH